MSDQYYYSVDGKREGPIPFTALRELATNGELKRTTKVWCQGMKEWERAGTLQKLFDDLPPDLERISEGPPPLPRDDEVSKSSSFMAKMVPQSLSSAIPSSCRNPRTLSLLAILVGLTIAVSTIYVNKAVAHAKWVRGAPDREAKAEEAREEMRETQKTRGRTAGQKFAQGAAVTGLLQASTRTELQTLAASVWERPSDRHFTTIVGDGQWIYQIRATGGYWNSEACREAFIEGFENGYVSYAREPLRSY